MYGLEAIQHANGWAMAVAGAGIVLCGLVVLSLLISMIPNLTGFLEKPKPKVTTEEPPPESEIVIPEKLLDDIRGLSSIYIALTEDLGKVFSLVDLHQMARKMGLPHPHLSIRRFREAGLLIPMGEGNFSWKPQSD